jgi:hypothetical protein
LDRVVDRIFSRDAAIKTPEAAVKWLEANKERLASYGGGNWGSPNADILILGIEPGDNPRKIYYDENGKILGRLDGPGVDATLTSDKWDQWYDRHPLVFVNDIRQRYVVKQASRSLVKEFEGSPLDSTAHGKLNLTNEKMKQDTSNFEVRALKQNKKMPFARKSGQILDNAGSSVMGLNISPFGLPSDKYWPFEKLPLKSNSVFRDRDSWLKYASTYSAKQISSLIDERPRKVVYIAATKDAHKNVFNKVAKNYDQVVENRKLMWKSSSGKEMKADVNLFVVDKGGNKTVVVQTNHPSWTGWSSSALNELNRLIRERQAG